MKKLLALVFILFFHSALAANQFKPENLKTFEGQILSIQKYRYANRPTPFVQFNLRTKNGDVSVDVGPEWFLKAEGINLNVYDRITVIGYLVKMNNKNYVIAKNLKMEGESLQLRNERGIPLWAHRTDSSFSPLRSRSPFRARR